MAARVLRADDRRRMQISDLKMAASDSSDENDTFESARFTRSRGSKRAAEDEDENSNNNDHKKLFYHENGEPMSFYMAPSREKAELKIAINNHGGRMASTMERDSTGVIKLAPEGSCLPAGTGSYFSSAFIDDSVHRQKKLDLQEYKMESRKGNIYHSKVYLETQKTMQRQFDDFMPENPRISCSSKSLKGRKKFRTSEDIAIILFLVRVDKCHLIGGNNVWQWAEKEKVTDHTWQSMRTRFIKFILPNINTYSLPKEVRKTLQVHFPTQRKKDKRPDGPADEIAEEDLSSTDEALLNIADAAESREQRETGEPSATRSGSQWRRNGHTDQENELDESGESLENGDSEMNSSQVIRHAKKHNKYFRSEKGSLELSESDSEDCEEFEIDSIPSESDEDSVPTPVVTRHASAMRQSQNSSDSAVASTSGARVKTRNNGSQKTLEVNSEKNRQLRGKRDNTEHLENASVANALPMTSGARAKTRNSKPKGGEASDNVGNASEEGAVLSTSGDGVKTRNNCHQKTLEVSIVKIDSVPSKESESAKRKAVVSSDDSLKSPIAKRAAVENDLSETNSPKTVREMGSKGKSSGKETVHGWMEACSTAWADKVQNNSPLPLQTKDNKSKETAINLSDLESEDSNADGEFTKLTRQETKDLISDLCETHGLEQEEVKTLLWVFSGCVENTCAFLDGVDLVYWTMDDDVNLCCRTNPASLDKFTRAEIKMRENFLRQAEIWYSEDKPCHDT